MTTPTVDQLAALGAAFDVFTRRYKLAEALGPVKPLNEVDKQVLFYVAQNDGCGPTDVARFLGVANTTISSATDRLAKAGLLKRERPEQDRRAVALRLTPQGQARVNALQSAYHAMYLRMLEPLTTDEQHAFIALIEKIVRDEA
ncbi:MarR family winged helix-turn-helix transcriptional regulator [Sphingomonas sp. 3-13AW]|uniref:MarR family winged helix-turn-helix transcriptional regulator n=1 Tax=Sphingomonas sp. 3-13AW TaxID=3050450 RepID=UPI003BB5613A